MNSGYEDVKTTHKNAKQHEGKRWIITTWSKFLFPLSNNKRYLIAGSFGLNWLRRWHKIS